MHSVFSLASYHKDDSGRINSGSEATPGQFPYQPALRYHGSNSPIGHVWGGSIIDTLWIITTAHCIKSTKSLLEPKKSKQIVLLIMWVKL